MGSLFCFIDDSSFEISLFRDVFGQHDADIILTCGTTFDEVHADLQKNNLTPSLFILDLYGRTGRVTTPVIPPVAELSERTATIHTLEAIYENLDALRDDPDLQVNEYLKRLFAIVGTWRTIFSDIACTLDQSPEYGISNLEHVRASYPDAAAVMYTRKGVFADAIRLAELGCDGIFMKPMGQTDEEILSATRAQRDQLMAKWLNIVNHRRPHKP